MIDDIDCSDELREWYAEDDEPKVIHEAHLGMANKLAD